MARLKIPGGSPEVKSEPHCAKQPDSSKGDDEMMVGSENSTVENVPLLVSEKQYEELFGNSDEEECFAGFAQEKSEQESPHNQMLERKSRRSTHASPNESNPYKKKYLSYRKITHRRSDTEVNLKSVENVISKLPCKPGSPKSPKFDAASKLFAFESHKKWSNANKAAKDLLNKAHKTKMKKNYIVTSSPSSIKMTIKYTQSSRPKRTKKSTIDHDFVYDTPALKRKYEMLLSPPEASDIKCKLVENDSKLDKDVFVIKKKARIKYASSVETTISQPKKKMKVKNISPIKETLVSPYERATCSDFVFEDAEGNCKGLDLEQVRENLEAIHGDENNSFDKGSVKNEMTESETEKVDSPGDMSDENIVESTGASSKVKKTELKGILSERERGWPFWNSYTNTYLSNKRLLRKHNSDSIIVEKEEATNVIVPQGVENVSELEEIKETVNKKKKVNRDESVPLGEENEERDLSENEEKEESISTVIKKKIVTKKKIMRDDRCPLTKKLKALHVNGVIKFVNMKNQLVTFCKECESCLNKTDCGVCKHCKNPKGHAIRVLPCWERRCSRPLVGPVINVKIRSLPQPKNRKPKENMKPKIKKEVVSENTDRKSDTEKTCTSPEKVELSFIPEHNFHHIKADSCFDDDAQIEFKVRHKKKKSENNTFAGSEVFTGMSPIKPKLRSTMNELTKKITSPEHSKALPLIPCGPETLVKLPWPNDTNEDAAWVAGHHICTIDSVEFNVANLCFLCGSGGKEKMLTCTFCCESFHPYCLDVDPVNTKNWCCDRCKRCVVCGLKENLLMCDKCHDCYHAECLGPCYQRDTEGDEETWICGKCVKCIKCNRRTAGKFKTSKWTHNFSMCENCGYNWKCSNYCPMCEKLYDEDDDSLKMMFCSKCEKWIHMECEGICVDDYEILAELPENVPYICKLCTGQDKCNSAWYKEVKEEMHSGFLKVYYDLVSHRDYKMLKRGLSDEETVTSSLQAFEVLFDTLQNHDYNCVKDFYVLMLEALKQLNINIKDYSVFDESLEIFPDGKSLIDTFEKSVNRVFPWFSSKSASEVLQVKDLDTKNSPVKHDYNVRVIIKENGQEKSLVHDHIYCSLSRTEQPEAVISKCEDNRRCLFCAASGDGAESGAGRLLYCGVNEWVHINCALWSAEVYEDDDGRLKHVNEALKRGNKLKCEYCDHWGASIGCCHLKCSKSYHFLCAMKSDVIFQDDKKIFCQLHASKASVNLVLSEKELAVPRRVLVDLTRFKSVKRVQRGLNPVHIRVFCGTFSLQSLGVLSENSDVKKLLIPAGYRVTRLFWSTKNPTQRCKYMCQVDVLHQHKEDEVIKEKNVVEILEDSVTYCHDETEWNRLTFNQSCSCKSDSFVDKKSKGVKRKMGFEKTCKKCDALRKYVFLDHKEFLSSRRVLNNKSMKTLSSSNEDHNFFSVQKSLIELQSYEKKNFRKVAKNETFDNLVDRGCEKSNENICDIKLNRKLEVTDSIKDIHFHSDSSIHATTCSLENKIKAPKLYSLEQKITTGMSLASSEGINTTVAFNASSAEIKPNSILMVPNTCYSINVQKNLNSYCDVTVSNSAPTTVVDPTIPNIHPMVYRTAVEAITKPKMTFPLNTTSPVRHHTKQITQMQIPSHNPLIKMQNHFLNLFSSSVVSNAVITMTCPPPKITPAHVSTVISNTVVSTTYSSPKITPAHMCRSNTFLPMKPAQRLNIFPSESSISTLAASQQQQHKSFFLPNILSSPKKPKLIQTISSSMYNTPNSTIKVMRQLQSFKGVSPNKNSPPKKKSCLNENVLIHAAKLINIAPKQTITYNAVPVMAVAKTTYQVVSAITTTIQSTALTISLPQPSSTLSIPKMVNGGISDVKIVANQVPKQNVYRKIPSPKAAMLAHTKLNVQNLNSVLEKSSSLGVMTADSTTINQLNISESHVSKNRLLTHSDKHNVDMFPPKCNCLVSPPPLITDTSNSLPTDKVIPNCLASPDLSKEINQYFCHLKSQHVTALESAGKVKFNERSASRKSNVHFYNTPTSGTNLNSYERLLPTTSSEMDAVLGDAMNKADSGIIPNLQISYEVNNSNLKNADLQCKFKREMLFRQLKEYLQKHPDVLRVVGNISPKGNQVPVVNLTEKKTSNDLICYSAYLPEHLWTELVNAGIASNDIQKIFRETKKDTLPPTVSKNGFVEHSYSMQTSEAKSTPDIGQQKNLNCQLPSLNTSIKNAYASKIQHVLTPSVEYKPQSNMHQSPYLPSKRLDNISGKSTTIDLTNIPPLYQPMFLNDSHTRNLNLTQRNVMNNHSVEQRMLGRYIDNNMNKTASIRDLISANLDPVVTLKGNIVPNDFYKMNSALHPAAWNNFAHTVDQMRNPPVPKPSRKYRKRIKVANVESSIGAIDREKLASIPFSELPLPPPPLDINSSKHSHKSGPVLSKRKRNEAVVDVMCANTEFDIYSFDENFGANRFVQNTVEISTGEQTKTKMIPKKMKRVKKQKRDYASCLKNLLEREEKKKLEKSQTSLKFVLQNEEGWTSESASLEELWKQLISELNELRTDRKLPPFTVDVNDAYDFLGLSKEFICYLVEQLPGGHKCRNYKFQHHLPHVTDDDEDLPVNPHGCARAEIVERNAENDMFAWLASPYRIPPKQCEDIIEDEILGGAQELPVAMRYRLLKNTAKDHVGVYRSGIQGRGLFCKKSIEAGDMIIEYSGEKIRAVLTDRREEYYEQKGYGCYMFRIDDMDVVDATMRGNSARFINHSCEPNCFSKIISVDGCKKIVIFALRRITVGEELTYDYKFQQEEDKLICFCGAKKCRKYLN